MMFAEHDLINFMLTAEQMRYEVDDQIAQRIPADPSVPPLYARLIDEEYKELKDAIVTENDAHIINEAVDLIWVTIGYMVAKGYSVNGAWQALTQANNAKLQKDPSTGKLLRRPDGKIQKPEGWKPADFSQFINRGGSK